MENSSVMTQDPTNTPQSDVLTDTATENFLTDKQREVCRMYRFTLSVVVVGGLCLAGTIGNLLALIVLRRFREKSSVTGNRSPTALILSALAVMDALVLISLLLVKSLPSLFYFKISGTGNRYLAISPYLWQWGWPLNDLFHAYSTWITVLVAAQRCVAVTFPHRAFTICSYSLTWGLIGVVVVTGHLVPATHLSRL